jgi:hypothetical protein
MSGEPICAKFERLKRDIKGDRKLKTAHKNYLIRIISICQQYVHQEEEKNLRGAYRE